MQLVACEKKFEISISFFLFSKFAEFTLKSCFLFCSFFYTPCSVSMHPEGVALHCQTDACIALFKFAKEDPAGLTGSESTDRAAD